MFLVSSLFFFVWFRAAEQAGYNSAFGRTLIYVVEVEVEVEVLSRE